MTEVMPGSSGNVVVRLRKYESVRILADEAEILVTGEGYVQATDPRESRHDLSAYTGGFKGYVTVQFNAANEDAELEKART